MEELVVHVVGARPNFVKMAPLITALADRGVDRQIVVHTGPALRPQDVGRDPGGPGLPAPRPLRWASAPGRHGEQTAKVLMAFEEVLVEERPARRRRCGRRELDARLRAGRASKLGIPVAHLESGLRSGDWTMPEEINRVLTDRLSDLLFTHSPEAEVNLAAEGIDASRVRYVGNTMIDSLRRCEGAARERAAWRAHGLEERKYVLVTLHRPSNVDEPRQLADVVTALVLLARRAPVVFPVHPRTRERLRDTGLEVRLCSAGVHCVDRVNRRA